MSLIKREIIFPKGTSDGYQLIPQPGRAQLGGVGLAEKGDDAVPYDQLLQLANGVWLNGVAAPSNTNGENGNFYYNTVNKNIYLKIAGAWVLQGTLAAGGGGGVATVIGNIVDNTDPANPVVTQVQSDWSQTDNTQPSYIANKPSFPTNGIAYIDIDFITAFLQQNVTNDWVDGWYRVTGIPGVDGYYARTFPDKNEVLKLSTYGEVQLHTNEYFAKGRINFGGGVIDQVELIVDNALYQKITSSVGVDIPSTFAYILGNPDWNNIDLIDPSITVIDSSNYITNLIGSVKETFTFTHSNQYFDSLNGAIGRILSFDSVKFLYYKNCTISNGKTVTVLSPQENKYCIGDESNFEETLNIDLAYDGVYMLDIGNCKHAGVIKLTSLGGIYITPTITNLKFWGTGYEELKEKTFTIDPVTCNPTFDTGVILFSITSAITIPFSPVNANDYITIRKLISSKYTVVDGNLY